MKFKNNVLAVSMSVLCISAAIVQQPVQAAPSNLNAIKTSTAPKLDGVANDAIWQSATAVSLRFKDGKNFSGTGKTTGTIKTAHDGKMLYMIMQ